MKKELLEINEMVKGDEIAEKIMSDLLDGYYKRESMYITSYEHILLYP